jgi:hypothetical protein
MAVGSRYRRHTAPPRPGAPSDERQQRDLKGNPKYQHPVGNSEQLGPLQHVEVGRRDRKRQCEQTHARGPACRLPQEPTGTQQFKRSADQNRCPGPGNGWGNDTHFRFGGNEVRNAADHEPQKNDPKADAPAAAGPVLGKHASVRTGASGFHCRVHAPAIGLAPGETLGVRGGTRMKRLERALC